MSRMATPTFPGQMFRDARQFDYGAPSTETVNRIAGSISPGAGLETGGGGDSNPWRQIGANEREAMATRQKQSASDAAAFADWYPKLTQEQHDSFSGGHKVGEQHDTYGLFPVESSPGVQDPGVYKAASLSGPRDADNIEGITRTAAQQYFLRQLNLGTQGTPPAPAGTTPAAAAAPAPPSSPSSPQLGPVTPAAPAAGSNGFSPVPGVAGPPAPVTDTVFRVGRDDHTPGRTDTVFRPGIDDQGTAQLQSIQLGAGTDNPYGGPLSPSQFNSVNQWLQSTGRAPITGWNDASNMTVQQAAAAQPSRQSPAPAAPPSPLASLPPIEPYAQQHQAIQQQALASSQQATEPAPDMSYLRTIYARATTPADRAAILRTIAATHGNEVRQQIAESTNDNRKEIAGQTNASHEKVAGENNDSRSTIAAGNNAARTQIAQLHSKDLLTIANNANDNRKEIARAEIEQRDRAIGEAERHHRGMEEEATQKLQQHGSLTPEDVARYRADFDKINQMRELHGLTPHPYPDYLAQSPSTPPAPAAPAPPPAAAAPDASRFVAGPNGLFIHPDLPNVTYRKVPGGYQRVN